jgi:arabinofuranan 3-O-arabinosyltransferase
MQTSRLPHLTLPIARSFVAVAAAIYLYDLFQQTHDHFTNGMGRPFGDDFINFWSGAYLAVHGHATQVYDPAAFHAFQQSVVGGALEGYLYIYPPVLLVLTAPLGLVPYIPALVLWLSAGWFAFYRALCLALPGRGALLLALATPAVFINTIAGQNGTWTAALFGGGLGLLNRRPMLAGGLLGLLVFKPQLAILIPVALAAGRHWRALAAAAVTAAALLAVSALWFGTDIWINYIRLVELLRRLILEEGTGVWYRFVSVFVAARRLGVPVETTYLVQGIATVLAGIAVALVWFRDAPAGIKNAVLLLGTCLATPFLQDYDLVFGALAVAWIWQASTASATALADNSERALIYSSGLFLLLPLFAASLAHITGLSFGPLFIVPIFVVTLKMSLHGFLNDGRAPALNLQPD